jgi:hypothetical protein
MVQETLYQKNPSQARRQRLMSIILTTQEVEIRRMAVEASKPAWENSIGAGRVTQG